MTQEMILKEHLDKVTQDYKNLLNSHINLINSHRRLELLNADLNKKVILLINKIRDFKTIHKKGGD